MRETAPVKSAVAKDDRLAHTVVVSTNAGGGSRTRTAFRPGDFKSPASAIPPPRPRIAGNDPGAHVFDRIPEVSRRGIVILPPGRTRVNETPDVCRSTKRRDRERCFPLSLRGTVVVEPTLRATDSDPVKAIPPPVIPLALVVAF